ncbi:MAG: hypothetical protein AB1801_18090, partial [Chloroflexota bacterium]
SLADALKEYHPTMSAEELERYLGDLAQNGHKLSNIINELRLQANVRRPDKIEMSQNSGE